MTADITSGSLITQQIEGQLEHIALWDRLSYTVLYVLYTAVIVCPGIPCIAARICCIDTSHTHVYMFQDANFMTVLELAVRFGKTLIIQEMDGVEPVLYPLLRRDLIAQGER